MLEHFGCVENVTSTTCRRGGVGGRRLVIGVFPLYSAARGVIRDDARSKSVKIYL